MLGRHNYWMQLQHWSSPAVCWCTVRAALSQRRTVNRCQASCQDTKTMHMKLPLKAFCLAMSSVLADSYRHCRMCMTWTEPLVSGSGEQRDRKETSRSTCGLVHTVRCHNCSMCTQTSTNSCPETAVGKKHHHILSVFLCLLMCRV